MRIPRTPSETDTIIGSNLRRLRVQRSMSLARLADSLGMTFQQIQKYENGLNRIAVATLIEMRKALRCELEDFLVGIDIGNSEEPAPQAFSSKAVSAASALDNISASEVKNSLVRLLAEIERSQY